MSITLTEWKARVEAVHDHVLRRWPGLEIKADDTGLSVRAPGAMTGSLRLDISREEDDLCMVPSVTVGSSSAYPSSITVALAQHNEARRVLDALHYVAREVDGERVYRDGECPCGTCGGRGTAFRSKEPCEACGGEGVR